MAEEGPSLRHALRTTPAGIETDATPGAPGGKAKTSDRAAKRAEGLAGLQERLFAEGTRSLLVVLQGIDTAGKGGVVEHVVGVFGPEGVRVTAFKRPTPEELAHDFLWRIRNALPGKGVVGVFDRSHYEDVLVPRVHGGVDPAEIERRYSLINDFEAELQAAGTTVVKCFLHISYAEQRERLLARLDDPTKHWKFRESDIDERAYWADYQAAFAAMIDRCSTDVAPWYVVPSDHKWYRNWAVGELLHETLSELDPQYPESGLDVIRLKARLRPPF